MRYLNSTALGSLRFFEAAARLLSFSRAAGELSITQRAVSHQVKSLEESLGCKLFNRVPRRITLTEEGKKFSALVARVLRELDEVAESVACAHRTTLDVRLRAAPSFAVRWLVPRLRELHKRHPSIRLQVITDYGYLDPAHRDFDLAVEFLQGSLPALHTEFFMEEYLTPVCSPEFLARHGPLETPAELKRCTLLHDADAWEAANDDAEWSHWLKEVGAPDVDNNRGQFFTLANMSIEAALSHQGIAMGRLSLVEELLKSRRLVAPFGQRVKSPTRYCLVYPEELADRPAIKAVVQWLREEASKRIDKNAEPDSRKFVAATAHLEPMSTGTKLSTALTSSDAAS